ncbi:solute carrier family 12 member 2-like isoform X1 [Patiria miniata]|uniref:Uncharacterized protein n=1 Tax=Patiria miniata TaxID=46514 RepID=A0A914BNB3_PATMI|nr:solute carrier family 12 member 2-like isoform X1 [Patiria miniata]XP_038076967.1 solute carrier family 12 member 2-like isoform X1 [Patiria miniata]
MSDSEACADGAGGDRGSALTSSQAAKGGGFRQTASEDESDDNMEEIELLENGSKRRSPRKSPSKKKLGRFHVKIINEKEPGKRSVKRNGNSRKGTLSSPRRQESADDAMEHSLATHSFGHTVEALPSLDHYRNRFSLMATGKQRPTLHELHEPKTLVNQAADTPVDAGGLAEISAAPTTPASAGVKFGWIKGVLVRCLLNIWGVMLFLRMSWIVGQAGVGFSILIVLMATVVTVLTTLSMSAICTNGEVKGGGAYYMISRSLGPQFGGSIGLIFSIANAIAVAMYVVGFAEVVRDLLVDNGLKIVDPQNDVRIIGEATLILLLGITMIGMAWEARAQLFLLLLLVIAMVNMMVGTFIPAPDHERAQGFQNYKVELLRQNFGPDYRDNEGFFSIFSIFFPAATGILAGANISGDLKDAQMAIPKGTLIAIAMTSVSYAGLAVVLGACMSREATGDIADVIAGNFTSACEEVGADCEYGLLNNFSVASLISGFAPLVLAGVFAATLSSALASLVSAPKVFQALCKDKIFPKIEFFAVGTGAGDEPRRAYILAFFIAAACIAIGELNAIAPIISNFFLMSYALINFSCFSASLAKSPGWRPAFRYYNMWVALLAAVLCMGVMFLINWYAALITIFIVTALYMYVHNTKPEINWGSSNQAFIYKQALTNTLKLNQIPAHVKTFRPQIIALTGPPECRPALVHFVSHITKSTSLLICGAVLTGEQNTNLMELLTDSHEKWLDFQKIKAFPAMVASPTLRTGAQALMQIGGLGKIKPNTIIMGFLGKWKTEKPQYVHDYVGIIHDAFDLNLGVGVLRIKESFDVSSALNTPGFTDYVEEEKVPDIKVEITPSSITEEGQEGEEPVEPLAAEPPNTPAESKIPSVDSTALIKGQPIDVVIKSMQKFQGKMPKGNIDVWWLLDDGGLTLLIPHLISMKSNWEKCKLRVFATTGKKEQIDREKMNMANMLSKFRIDCSDVEIIPDLNKKPKEESLRRFKELSKPWMLDEEAGETTEKFPWKISKEEIITLKEKVKFLR